MCYLPCLPLHTTTGGLRTTRDWVAVTGMETPAAVVKPPAVAANPMGAPTAPSNLHLAMGVLHAERCHELQRVVVYASLLACLPFFRRLV